MLTDNIDISIVCASCKRNINIVPYSDDLGVIHYSWKCKNGNTKMKDVCLLPLSFFSNVLSIFTMQKLYFDFDFSHLNRKTDILTMLTNVSSLILKMLYFWLNYDFGYVFDINTNKINKKLSLNIRNIRDDNYIENANINKLNLFYNSFSLKTDITNLNQDLLFDNFWIDNRQIEFPFECTNINFIDPYRVQIYFYLDRKKITKKNFFISMNYISDMDLGKIIDLKLKYQLNYVNFECMFSIFLNGYATVVLK